MKYCLTVITIALFFLIQSTLNAQTFGGNPATLKWKQINTKTNRIIFPEGMDSQARRIYLLANKLDNSTSYSIGNKKRKWNTLLQNQTIISNAYVRMAPVMSELYMTPDQDNFSLGSLRWDDNLIIHEDRHMQQFSNFNTGLTRVFSFLLGQEGQLLANGISIPDYFFEGDAVWQETIKSPQGRGRMPSFFNGQKSLWLQDKHYSWMKLRSGSFKQYTPDHYQTGYVLVAYGYEKYGPDFWKKVTTDAVNFKGIFYAFNHAVEKYSGERYADFCKNALLYFRDKTVPAQPTKPAQEYITSVQKNNVTSYIYPVIVGPNTLLVIKKSYQQVSSFYLIVDGKEKKLRVKDYSTDDYFSYRNGKIVYTAYRSDPLRGNRDYNEIRLLDIHTNKQRIITFKSKYFSPDINETGNEIIAVTVNSNGSNYIQQINTSTGKLKHEVPNPNNYFYTQIKYINSHEAIASARHTDGRMALLKVNLNDGSTLPITAFTYNVIGYPSVKNDTVYYGMMHNSGNSTAADKIFAVDLNNQQNYLLSNNENGIYYPVVTNDGTLVTSNFTADGYRLQKTSSTNLLWKPISSVQDSNRIANISQMQYEEPDFLQQLGGADSQLVISPYKKTHRLFNFHSARPFISDVEYGYTFYGNNVLSSFSNSIEYIYNTNEQSHSLSYHAVFSGAFPFFTGGLEYTYNRKIDTAFNQSIRFNAANSNIGFYIPLRFIGGRTFKNLNFGAVYNLEQVPYKEIGKNVFTNNSFHYLNSFFSFSNSSRQAKQHINPHWAQSVSLNYRKGFNYFKTSKLTLNSAFYFPGLLVNHSIVLNAALQVRDTMTDMFSNNFSFARGYESLNTRHMLKLGANYHLPLLYPDWGFGNIIYFQRIRANAFFDYNIARARVRGKLTDIKNRSIGTEIYFDTKIWNALPASIGIRYSHLLDTDLLNPGAKGIWEIVLPINIIPN